MEAERDRWLGRFAEIHQMVRAQGDEIESG